MEIIQSLFIGAVQGITEFLPISSTAHLILIPKFFGWPDLGLKLDTALHFGTALAIIIYFSKDWFAIFKNAFGRKTLESAYPKNILWQIIIASIPAAIAGFLIQDRIETLLYTPKIIAFTLVFFGLLILLIDKLVSKNKKIADLKYGQSFIVGVAQMIALIPGVSRSGITMIASRMIGLSREDSARFSFVLSTPAVLGAFGLQAIKITANDLTLSFILSVFASAVFGYLAIKFLLNFLKKSDYSVFAVYRIILAILVLIVLVF